MRPLNLILAASAVGGLVVITACSQVSGASNQRSISESDPESLRACRSTVSQDSATPTEGCSIER